MESSASRGVLGATLLLLLLLQQCNCEITRFRPSLGDSLYDATGPRVRRQELEVVECTMAGGSGLTAHPTDCTKFLNCFLGKPNIQSCGPGTVFNPSVGVCDWPDNVPGCGDAGRQAGRAPQTGGHHQFGNQGYQPPPKKYGGPFGALGSDQTASASSYGSAQVTPAETGLGTDQDSYQGSQSGSYQAGSQQGAQSGSYQAGSLSGAQSGSYQAGSLSGAQSGSYQAGSLSGAQSGSYQAGSLSGAQSGSYQAGSLSGAQSGSYQAGSLSGAQSGSYQAGSQQGAQSGSYQAGSVSGAQPGSYQAGSQQGAESGSFQAGSQHGAQSGSYQAGSQQGWQQGYLSGSYQAGSQQGYQSGSQRGYQPGSPYQTGPQAGYPTDSQRGPQFGREVNLDQEVEEAGPISVVGPLPAPLPAPLAAPMLPLGHSEQWHREHDHHRGGGLRPGHDPESHRRNHDHHFHPYAPRPGSYKPGYNPYQPMPGGYNPYNPKPGTYNPYNPKPGGYDPYNPKPGGYNPYYPKPGGYNPYAPKPSGGGYYPQSGKGVNGEQGYSRPGQYNPQREGSNSNQPGDYTPEPEYTPPGGGYGPPKGGYEPSKGGYPPKRDDLPGGTTPNPERYTTRPGGQGGGSGYKPQQGWYVPLPGEFRPPPAGYRPQQGGYSPQQGGYSPQKGGYNPQQGGYSPQPEGSDSQRGNTLGEGAEYNPSPGQEGGYNRPQVPPQENPDPQSAYGPGGYITSTTPSTTPWYEAPSDVPGSDLDYDMDLRSAASSWTDIVNRTKDMSKPQSGQMVRLRGGPSPMEGYVEVMGPGSTWGAVCDRTSWTVEEASIVCMMLGFERGAELAWQGRPIGDPSTPARVHVEEVSCRGNESSLLDCKMSSGDAGDGCDIETQSAALRCYPNWASRCRPGEMPFQDSCYSVVVPRQDRQVRALGSWQRDADSHCASQQGHVVHIDSQAESDFVSEWLGYSYPALAVVLTAGEGVSSRNASRTSSRALADQDDQPTAEWRWQGRQGDTPKSMAYSLWWPGPPAEHADKGNGPEIGGRPMCVMLKKDFPCDAWPGSTGGNSSNSSNSSSTGTSCTADHFYWHAEDCAARQKSRAFICEREADKVDCLSSGEYEGSANVSSTGLPCLPWDSPLAVNALLYRVSGTVRRTLAGHNYCRRAGSKNEPWCLVEVNGDVRAEMCDIPLCGRGDPGREENGEVDENVVAVDGLYGPDGRPKSPIGTTEKSWPTLPTSRPNVRPSGSTTPTNRPTSTAAWPNPFRGPSGTGGAPLSARRRVDTRPSTSATTRSQGRTTPRPTEVPDDWPLSYASRFSHRSAEDSLPPPPPSPPSRDLLAPVDEDGLRADPLVMPAGQAGQGYDTRADPGRGYGLPDDGQLQRSSRPPVVTARPPAELYRSLLPGQKYAPYPGDYGDTRPTYANLFGLLPAVMEGRLSPPEAGYPGDFRGENSDGNPNRDPNEFSDGYPIIFPNGHSNGPQGYPNDLRDGGDPRNPPGGGQRAATRRLLKPRKKDSEEDDGKDDSKDEDSASREDRVHYPAEDVRGRPWERPDGRHQVHHPRQSRTAGQQPQPQQQAQQQPDRTSSEPAPPAAEPEHVMRIPRPALQVTTEKIFFM